MEAEEEEEHVFDFSLLFWALHLRDNSVFILL